MLHVAMDDDCKEYGKNKPPQKLYQPGSGPLRRTSYGFDAKMEIGVNNDLQGRENHRPNNKNNTTSRLKKPERELYVARSGDNCFDSYSGDSSNYRANKPDKHHLSSHSTNNYSKKEFYRDGSNKEINFNRQNRQASESRSMTMQMKDNNDDRNRDSRSMETSSKRYTNFGGKPPSGRRNSSGYIVDSGRFKHPMNLDNIPPRFRKKFLESSSGHHSFDGSEHLNKEKSYSSENTQTNHSHNQYIAPNPSWSQTLPSRGRGRQKEEYVGFDREKFINTYLKNLNATNKSTLSNSYVNLYESIPINNQVNDNVDVIRNSVSQDSCNMDDNVTKNGAMSDSISENKENSKSDGTNQQGRDNFSHSSTVDMVLDWTEEVEKNIKLEEALDTSTSFMQNIKSSTSQEVNFAEPREPKRSGRSRRRDRRSSSRGQRNAEKKNEKLRKDSNVSVTLENDDNNFGLHHEAMSLTFKQKDRERRDSHRSNRSSTIGNSREDLDRWRSLRSYSREHSTEGRIMSQCNSRETSMNRSTVSRDFDGFRVPAVPKIKGSVCGDVATGGERGRQSPAHSNAPVVAAPTEAGGGGRRGRKRASRRRGRHTEPALPVPAPHPPGAIPAPTSTNWRDEIIEAKKHTNDKKSDSGHNRNRLHSGMSDKSESSNAHPGILVLPQNSVTNLQRDQGHRMETQKTLFDPQNPSKPIVVQTSTSQDSRMEQGPRDGWSGSGGGAGYECEAEAGDRARGARHRALLQEVDRADAILQAHSLRGPIALAHHWGDVIETRKLLQNALQRLLMSDLKYCQANNVEHQFWKILYYNFIEVLRKSFTQVSAEDKPKIVKLINVIIAEGNTYFENLVQMLEKTYKFNTDDYINDNHPLPPKGLGYVGLALISVQKMYVFLGDLARYKEQVNETNNYSKSKFWYTKAQQINPKNGRPYNQLAILAIYARRKLDAVYYYMRSLMSSNPFHSARESLLSLFDENRKKYEAAERKRRVALESMKSESSAEGESGGAVRRGGGLRREVWVRPSGSKTTTLRPHAEEQRFDDMSSVELNKIFITSYLHVHGKLITKIGMETFHESAVAMLRQFRALLSRQPLQTPAARLLQLTALNMFAVETCANKKDSSSDGSGGRGAWLECALGVSLLMFGAMLERCCALLPEPHNSQPHTDALLLLPAIKVWSDWMLCHSSIWNPPPSFENYEMEDNDPWDWLAKLMNILEDLDDKSIELENEMKEGYVQIRLAEDASLAGFTPLMYMEPAAGWVRPDPALPPHHAEHLLRTRNLLFFGTEYLVGVDPPVLTLEYPAGGPPRYVSAVKHNTSAHHQLHNLVLSEDSEDEEESCSAPISGMSTPTREPRAEGPEGADEATRNLLRRKEQLETHKATLEQRRQRMQEILRGGWISVELEVRPRWLVPDTNCFIDHLPLLQAIEAVPSQPYLLAVPLVVMTELEGLTRCERVGGAAGAALRWVGGAAGVRLATARGSLLASRAFTAEHTAPRTTNDDRVLATALNLHQNLASEPDTCGGGSGGEGGRVRRVREVVLLTDDRNLRVKALAADLPARDLPSFVRWAGIQSTEDLTGIDFKTRRSK